MSVVRSKCGTFVEHDLDDVGECGCGDSEKLRGDGVVEGDDRSCFLKVLGALWQDV